MRLQFIFTNKQVKITTILFKNVTPILDIDKIAYFKETGLSGTWLKKEFRYSFDNTVWSNWNTLTQQALINLKFTNQPQFYIEVLYTRASYNSANITDLYLFYDSNTGTTPDPSTGTIDADTLQGQPGEYYLNRDNQYGPYNNLYVRNNIVDSSNAAGVYDPSTRVDSSVGTTITFKQLVGKNGIVIRDTSVGTIEIDASGFSGGPGGSYQNDSPVAKTVGGINTGETFFMDEKTFADTMAKMFYPVEYPSLSNPDNTINTASSKIQEIGNVIDFTITTTFSRGSINPAYGTSGYRSGLPTSYEYTGAQIAGSQPSGAYSDNKNLTNYLILQGSQEWSSKVHYNMGEQPVDSEGHPYDSALPAGSTSFKTLSIEGVYPIFATTSSVSTDTKQPLYSMITTSMVELDMAGEDGINKQSFEIPFEWELNNPLSTVETYNTFSEKWTETGLDQWNMFSIVKDIYSSNVDYTQLNMFSEVKDTKDIYSNNVNYTKYIYNGPQRDSTKIRLVF